MIGTALKSLITASEYDDVLKSAVILCLMLKDLFVMPDTVSVHIENSEYDPKSLANYRKT
ncbi:MAG: hypothetical protein ACLT33_00920 [Lachnospira pectinoschiza]